MPFCSLRWPLRLRWWLAALLLLHAMWRVDAQQWFVDYPSVVAMNGAFTTAALAGVSFYSSSHSTLEAGSVSFSFLTHSPCGTTGFCASHIDFNVPLGLSVTNIFISTPGGNSSQCNLRPTSSPTLFTVPTFSGYAYFCDYNAAWTAGLTGALSLSFVQLQPQLTTFDAFIVFSGWLPLAVPFAPILDLTFDSDPSCSYCTDPTYLWQRGDTGNAADPVTGRHLGLLLLNGHSQWVDLNATASDASSVGASLPQLPAPSPAGLDPILTGFSIELMITWTTFGNNAKVLDWSAGPYDYNILIGEVGTTGQVSFVVFGSGGFTTQWLIHILWAMTVETWYHIVVTVQRNSSTNSSIPTYSTYVNGQQVPPESSLPSALGPDAYPPYVSRPLAYLGRSSWDIDSYFDGSIDTLRVYPYSLTPQMVQQLFAFPNHSTSVLFKELNTSFSVPFTGYANSSLLASSYNTASAAGSFRFLLAWQVQWESLCGSQCPTSVVISAPSGVSLTSESSNLANCQLNPTSQGNSLDLTATWGVYCSYTASWTKNTTGPVLVMWRSNSGSPWFNVSILLQGWLLQAVPYAPVLDLSFDAPFGTPSTYTWLPGNTTAVDNATGLHLGVLSFDGISQWADLNAASGGSSVGAVLPELPAPSPPGLNQNLTGFSIELMVRWTNFQYGCKVLDWSAGATQYNILIGEVTITPQVTFGMFGDKGFFAEGGLTIMWNTSLHVWYHIVVTVQPIDNGTNTSSLAYVDGQPISAFLMAEKYINVTYPADVLRQDAWLGRSSWAAPVDQDMYFSGEIDTLRVYSYSLTPSMVQSLYNMTVNPPQQPPPVLRPSSSSSSSLPPSSSSSSSAFTPSSSSYATSASTTTPSLPPSTLPQTLPPTAAMTFATALLSSSVSPAATGAPVTPDSSSSMTSLPVYNTPLLSSSSTVVAPSPTGAPSSSSSSSSPSVGLIAGVAGGGGFVLLLLCCCAVLGCRRLSAKRSSAALDALQHVRRPSQSQPSARSPPATPPLPPRRPPHPPAYPPRPSRSMTGPHKGPKDNRLDGASGPASLSSVELQPVQPSREARIPAATATGASGRGRDPWEYPYEDVQPTRV